MERTRRLRAGEAGSGTTSVPERDGGLPARRRIYLMRHADVSYFDEDGKFLIREDVPLTLHGRRHARVAANALASVPFDRVVASGMKRTMETADLVLRKQPHAPPIEIWHQFSEMQSGLPEEIPREGLEESFLGVFRRAPRSSTRFLGGEDIDSLFDRVIPALERLIGEEGWQTILMVLHGAVNRAILSYALTGGRTFLGNIQQGPACMNILDVDAEWLVWAINASPYDVAHVNARCTSMETMLHQYRRSIRR